MVFCIHDSLSFLTIVSPLGRILSPWHAAICLGGSNFCIQLRRCKCLEISWTSQWQGVYMAFLVCFSCLSVCLSVPLPILEFLGFLSPATSFLWKLTTVLCLRHHPLVPGNSTVNRWAETEGPSASCYIGILLRHRALQYHS